MSARAPPSGYQALQRSEFARAFGRIIGVRAYVAPVVGTGAVLLALIEPSPWRRAVLVGLPAVLVGASLLEVLRYRRRGMAPWATELNLLLAVAGQLVAAFATGGLESPVMPLVLVLALLVNLVIDATPWVLTATLAVQLATPWAFAALAITGARPDFNPRFLGGGGRGGHGDVHLLLGAAVLSVGTVAASRLGRELRRLFDQMLWRALAANDELRQEQAERGQALLALTGGIAHELKNPLSSVKGLAALLGQQLPDGKGAERLAVLRGEVDRMQVILEEFLNFSRPLAPLTVGPARLQALCAEVAALHEGVARARGVALALEGEAEVRCDARKVRQVLINLVQNALDASPPGSVVALRCEAGPAGATLRVEDRGPGLEPAIVGRLFEPGATTKPQGNGLGLTVARALARQHGGELALGPREGGGCAAVVTLPLEPAVPGGER